MIDVDEAADFYELDLYGCLVLDRKHKIAACRLVVATTATNAEEEAVVNSDKSQLLVAAVQRVVWPTKNHIQLAIDNLKRQVPKGYKNHIIDEVHRHFSE